MTASNNIPEKKALALWFSFLLLLLFFSSCNVKKEALKTKTRQYEQKDLVKESVKVTEEKRKGGTINTSIIPEEDRERDDNGLFMELIQEIQEGGLTKTIFYKPDGKVDVECTADEIWTRIEEKLKERDQGTIDSNTKEKKKDKTETFNATFILYIIIGVSILTFWGFILLYKTMNKHGKVLGLITNKLER